MFRRYTQEELQTIANRCWDYLGLHDNYWYDVTFDRTGLEVDRETEFGATFDDLKKVWINPTAHEDSSEHMVKTLLHECWHVFWKNGLRLKYYEETMAITMEPILFDMWEGGLF